jgi:mannose-1-phosphate guanylyltransferase
MELVPRRSHWCIVVADDGAPEWAPYSSPDLEPTPVQYSCLGGSATLLHRALHRAAAIAPASQIMVTLLDEYRERWESILWCVRPEMRFVGDKLTSPQLTSAAAILSIAKASPSSIVTLLPARCYVAHESILRQALKLATAQLSQVPEGVATLGMLDIDEGMDEDYLVVGRPPTGRGLSVHGIARRPTSWVARHLRRQGAVVASGISIGYAGAFAAHIVKHWPGVSQRLSTLAARAHAARTECQVPASVQSCMPGSLLKSLRWHPPAFPQRLFTVCDSGWSGLKSPQAVARIADFVASKSRRPLSLLPRASDLIQGAPVAL